MSQQSSTRTIPSVHVAAGIIWKNNRFLAAKRPEGKPRGGFWEFPGGKQEANETMEETLCRELHEELGITAESIEPWEVLTHTYPDLHVTLHFMHVFSFSGEPTPHDGQTLRWITPEEAQTLQFLPADIAIVEKLVVPQK